MFDPWRYVPAKENLLVLSCATWIIVDRQVEQESHGSLDEGSII
jgi:hypothetical protein